MEDKQESTNQQKKVSVGKATWEKLTKKASVVKNDDQNGSKGENDNPVKASKADSGRKTSAPVGERKVSATKEKWSSVTKKVSLLVAMATLQTGLNETEEDKMPAMINNFRPPVPLYERNVKLFDGERTKTYDEQKSKGEVSVKELKKEIEEMKQLLRENRQQDMTDAILGLKDSMQALQMAVAGLRGNQCPCHK